MKKTKTMRKVVACLLAFVLLLSVVVLAGCSKNSTNEADYSIKYEETAAAYFKRCLEQNAVAREKFTAASHGYNMSAEGFDDNNLVVDPEAVDGVSLAGAKAALTLCKPTDAQYESGFNAFLDELTPEMVQNIVVALQTSVDLTAKNGAIDSILIGIGKFLQILTKITGGYYVLGLFIFAIVVELLMLPLGIRQQKNSIKQARLRPKEMAIRKKYAGRNDQATQQKMNQEIQKLYQEEGFNPMGGCLPLLIQFPVIIALYQIVIDPLHYVLGKAASLSTALTTYCNTARAAGGLGESLTNAKGTVELLSKIGADKLEGLKNFAYFSNSAECYEQLKSVSIPNFNLFGINMGIIPDIKVPSLLWLVPVLTFVFYFFSMKFNRKFMYQPTANDPQMGCSNNMMDIMMPLMSVYISFIVPAAIGVYWIFKCIITTLKQFIVNKFMPLPTFTEEEYKAAEREMKGKAKVEKKEPGVRTTGSGKQVRSLHHIDDDDDMLPPPQKDEEEEETPKPKMPPKMEAPLKEDRKDNNNENK